MTGGKGRENNEGIFDQALRSSSESAAAEDRTRNFQRVMAGLDPAIHVFAAVKTWMPGSGPGMTGGEGRENNEDISITPSSFLQNHRHQQIRRPLAAGKPAVAAAEFLRRAILAIAPRCPRFEVLPRRR
jgi:hypothetical protein